MKLVFLFTLLFSSQAFSEIRVNINSQKEGVFYRDFKTQAEADAYKAEVIANNHWGQPGTYTLTDQDVTATYAQAAQLQSDISAAAASIDSFLAKPSPTQAEAVLALKALIRHYLKK